MQAVSTPAYRPNPGVGADARVVAGVAGLLGFGALAFAAVGWSMAVLPSLRTLSPAELPVAARLSAVAPVLIAVGGVHGLAAILALSRSSARRRWSAALVACGAIIAAVIALLRTADGGPDPAAASNLLPLLALAAIYLSASAAELSTTRPRS